MSRKLNTDVLVVGAGPSGLVTALSLAEAGVRVAIIDREQRPATHSYACGLHPRSLELFQELGLLSAVQETARRITRVALYSPEGGREAELSLDALPVAFSHVLVLPQDQLEARLAERLAQLGCPVLWHHRLTNLEPGPDLVRADVDQLVGTATGCAVPRWQWVVGRTLEVQATFVVGADGHHSMVRQALGIENERLAPPEHYAVYEFEPEAALTHEMCLVLNDQAKSVLWPLPGHRCRWSFQLPGWAEADFETKDHEAFWAEPPDIARRTQERLQQRLTAQAPWFGTSIRALDWAVDIQFQHRLARQYGRGRCWLVGDAAHQTAPAGIQSMNIGLLEARELAGKLVQIIRDAAPEQLLAEYERARLGEWRRLLGGRAVPKPGASVKPWIARHAGQIVSSLPAAGRELDLLLAQLGLELP